MKPKQNIKNCITG